MTLPLRSLFGLALACLAAAPAVALSVIPPSFPELVAEADTIVLGTITEVTPRRMTGAQGRSVIRTFVRVRVDATLKGAPNGILELSYLGGSVGGEHLRVAGMPEFRVGAREFLFVRGNGHGLCPLVGAAHGAYPVQHDAATGRDRVLRRDGQPLQSIGQIGQPLAAAAGPRALAAPVGLEPANFQQAVRELLDRQAKAAR